MRFFSAAPSTYVLVKSYNPKVRVKQSERKSCARCQPGKSILAPDSLPGFSGANGWADGYFDALRIFNTYNNLSPRPGLPKYLEIRGNRIFNGTENGTELKCSRPQFANSTCPVRAR